MPSIPNPVRRWMRDYITSESGTVAGETVKEVPTRDDIPDHNGLFYVADEDRVVLRINV